MVRITPAKKSNKFVISGNSERVNYRSGKQAVREQAVLACCSPNISVVDTDLNLLYEPATRDFIVHPALYFLNSLRRSQCQGGVDWSKKSIWDRSIETIYLERVEIAIERCYVKLRHMGSPVGNVGLGPVIILAVYFMPVWRRNLWT